MKTASLFRIPKPDIIISLLLFVVAFVAVYRASTWKEEQYLWAAEDIWFDSDIERVVRLETQSAENYDRTMMHPLFSYTMAAPIRIASKFIWKGTVVRFYHAAVGALWVALFYLLIRRFGCRRPDSVLLTGALATTSTAIFWLTIPESFVVGGVSMYPALALAATPVVTGLWPHALAIFLSFGMTITNGMAGLSSALAALPIRRFLAATGIAVALLAAIGFSHSIFFSGSKSTLSKPGGEAAWVFCPEAGGPDAILRSYFVSSVVAPEIGFAINWQEPRLPMMTFQWSRLLTGTAWAWPATVAWMIILALGFYGLFSLKDIPALRPTLILFVCGHLLLHLIYGRETFLYAPHFVPGLFAVAALGTRTKFRPAVLALASVLIVTNVVNNVTQYRWAYEYTNRNGTLNVLQKSGKIYTFVPPPEDQDVARQFRFWRDLEFFPKIRN